MSDFTNCPFANQDPSLRSTHYSKGRVLNRKAYKIDTITLHCVVGHCKNLQALARIFQGTKEASSNYGIMDDGEIGMFVEEKDRAWTSSNASNDVRAVTAEINSDNKKPYAMTDGAVNGAIRLCVDVCKRNGIKQMHWIPNKEKALAFRDKEMPADHGIFTVHRWFARKSCPGDFLYNKMGWVCDEVNKQLGTFNFDEFVKEQQEENRPKELKSIDEVAQEVIDGKWGNGIERVNKLREAGYNPSDVQAKVNEKLAPKPQYYRVQVGAFKIKDNALNLKTKLEQKGYQTYLVEVNGLWKVQVGAYSKRSNADNTLMKLALDGFKGYVVQY